MRLILDESKFFNVFQSDKKRPNTFSIFGPGKWLLGENRALKVGIFRRLLTFYSFKYKAQTPLFHRQCAHIPSSKFNSVITDTLQLLNLCTLAIFSQPSPLGYGFVHAQLLGTLDKRRDTHFLPWPVGIIQQNSVNGLCVDMALFSLLFGLLVQRVLHQRAHIQGVQRMIRAAHELHFFFGERPPLTVLEFTQGDNLHSAGVLRGQQYKDNNNRSFYHDKPAYNLTARSRDLLGFKHRKYADQQQHQRTQGNFH